ncbi:tetratricopeptide repeat protein [Evansella sp. LMS18]|uniref:tetratricopeptide repeat protein n=1 Tax=Evansella sp. LMS18 TaxID=2924033 RepID=UPI0020D0064D|nr:tetratricopeptide repeat protein [Evansella sp. LMS18]UTR11291.1 tetratricopeptide repeat protein [Evansella sp. LMS18]
MGKQGDGQEDNVILFPGLVAKLVEKGMSSLKEKKYYDALRYFQQSAELEPSHPQARYGLVITNIELNRLNEAKSHCESMLREGIGNYYEVLQVYVSLLVQLGDYQEVETILESVISEERLPADMAESFYQLLEFARQMTSPEIADFEDEIDEESIEGLSTTKEWIDLLEKGETDQQWGAIQKLSQLNTKEVQNAYRTFLKERDKNPVIKSYLLQTLKELDVKGTFEVHKFGNTYEVKIEDLEDVFHEKFGTQVINELEKELGQESPSLFEMVQQVWWHFLFALYPKSPVPLDTRVWAAALHVLGLSLMDNEKNRVKQISQRYRAQTEEVNNAVIHMRKIEAHLFKTKQ